MLSFNQAKLLIVFSVLMFFVLEIFFFRKKSQNKLVWAVDLVLVFVLAFALFELLPWLASFPKMKLAQFGFFTTIFSIILSFVISFSVEQITKLVFNISWIPRSKKQ